MSRKALIAVITGAVVVVAVLAVLTPTVIVDDHDGHGRTVRVMAPAGSAPFPFRQGRLPNLGKCLQRHGFDRSNLPGLEKAPGALRDCLRPRLR